MKTTPNPYTAAAALMLSLALSLLLPIKAMADCAPPWERLVSLAADHIDSSFAAVAASTQALGDEYARLADHQTAVTDADRQRWIERRSVQGKIAGFRSWPAAQSQAPTFQSEYPGLYNYNYNAERLSDADLQQLQHLEQLVPLFRSAYHSFDFSWVYLTTADEQMLIYPYLPIAEAANNQRPTQQLFYTAADFDQRAVGWTLPYLDLGGAGMMITASYPVYAGDTLLGVASRDITLKQLSASVLSHLANNGAIAYIVDDNGLVIDASDADMAAEVNQVNKQAGAAVLYYRTPAELSKQGADPANPAIPSRFTAINALTDRVIAQAAQARDKLIAFKSDGHQVLSARIAHTGWFVVLVLPQASG